MEKKCRVPLCLSDYSTISSVDTSPYPHSPIAELASKSTSIHIMPFQPSACSPCATRRTSTTDVDIISPFLSHESAGKLCQILKMYDSRSRYDFEPLSPVACCTPSSTLALSTRLPTAPDPSASSTPAESPTSSAASSSIVADAAAAEEISCMSPAEPSTLIVNHTVADTARDSMHIAASPAPQNRLLSDSLPRKENSSAATESPKTAGDCSTKKGPQIEPRTGSPTYKEIIKELGPIIRQGDGKQAENQKREGKETKIKTKKANRLYWWIMEKRG